MKKVYSVRGSFYFSTSICSHPMSYSTSKHRIPTKAPCPILSARFAERVGNHKPNPAQASSPQMLGAPGLAFETWDSMNPNRPHSTSHTRRVPHPRHLPAFVGNW